LLGLLEAILLGLIQGITEWLPVSSEAHLRLAEYYLGLSLPILFDVMLHIGTLVVVLVFFRSDVRKILSALRRLDFKSEYGEMIPLIVVATIPTALIGLLLGGWAESTFQTPLPIAVTLILGGVLLFASKEGPEKTDHVSYLVAFLIGVAQGIAVIPGVSRSGITISTALLLGLKREKAFKFSFLASIPAIVGDFGASALREGSAMFAAGVGWVEVFAGVLVAMVVGYFALKLVRRTLQTKTFHLFAVYRWLLALALILLLFYGF
jgi:undecaprenyl-diphosphatase